MQSADRVLLELGQIPERWQVIGFKRSNDDQPSIKRVVGLPGETVWFERGNIFLQTKDGQAVMLKKNWAQQKLTRILVHDNRFQDDDPRWLPLDPASPLSTSMPAKFQTSEYPWLQFQPKRCYDHSDKQVWSPQIEDSYGFNQNISRSLNPVNEVCLEFEFNSDLAQASDSKLLVAIVTGKQTHLAQIVFKRDWMEVQLFDRDKQVTEVTRCRIAPDSRTCAVSNVDSQIIVAVGDQQVQLLELTSQKNDSQADPGSGTEHRSQTELLVSLQPSNLENLRRLRVWRDIYYYSPLSRDELLKRQAGTGLAGTEGYFVVGDNLPVSWDSRRWLLPRVATEDILGVVDIGQ